MQCLKKGFHACENTSGQLIPPVPNSANYLHWLHDLLGLSAPPSMSKTCFSDKLKVHAGLTQFLWMAVCLFLPGQLIPLGSNQGKNLHWLCDLLGLSVPPGEYRIFPMIMLA